MFYAKLIVPLFNKQTPLENGTLKSAIESYGKKVGFTIHNIFIIDGSKRSTKANAYFSGFGSQKRIPYTPLHDIYPGFKCPTVDSYKNKLDWISIFP